MRTRRGIGAVGAALVVGTLLAGSGPAQAAGAEVPFTAKLDGQIAFTSDTTVAWSGTGTGLQLGSATGSGSIALTGPDDGCPGGIANVHTATLTAASGDTLTLTSADVACPVSPYEFHGSGHWTVTAGTGRFAGVTGSGSIIGHGNFATGVFTVSWTGSLTL